MKHFKSILAAVAACAGLAAFAPTAAAQALEASHAPGMCLDFSSGRGVLARCTGDRGQDLDVPRRGADFLKVGRFCVAAGNSGSQLYTSNCRNNSDQFWSFNQNGSLVNGSGLCADVEGGSRREGARVIAYRCGGKSNQRFTAWDAGHRPGRPGRPGQGHNHESQVLLSPGHAGGMCVDHDRKTGRLILWGCHGKSNQVFTLSQRGNTELRVNNLCVTATRGNRSPVQVANCTGRRDQSWTVQNDRTIRNEATGLCLDVDGGGRHERTAVISFKCSGKTNQRFNFYAR